MSLDLFNRFFHPLIFRTLLKSAEKRAEKCEVCKGKMVDTISYLYLIPAKFDDEHEESAEYYIHNGTRIESTEQIPNGNRACRMYVFQCQSCAHKKVSVVDFLKVRENELIKAGDIYPYEKFQAFFSNNQSI